MGAWQPDTLEASQLQRAIELSMLDCAITLHQKRFGELRAATETPEEVRRVMVLCEGDIGERGQMLQDGG